MKKISQSNILVTKVIWNDPKNDLVNPVVLIRKDGGLVYCYNAVGIEGAPRCHFTMFCEVGEPYQSAFNGFFNQKRFKLAKKRLELNDWPYLFDQLAKKPTDLPKIADCIKYIESTGWKYHHRFCGLCVFHSLQATKSISFTLSELRHAFKNGW